MGGVSSEGPPEPILTVSSQEHHQRPELPEVCLGDNLRDSGGEAPLPTTDLTEPIYQLPRAYRRGTSGSREDGLATVPKEQTLVSPVVNVGNQKIWGKGEVQ